MAGLITVRLSRNDAQPWGFRLQGGKDFGAPLLIQKVNGGSLAEKAGLQVADAVIKVNGLDVYNLRHKDAQDAIVKAGNSFEVVVSRGPGSTWKPAVTPVGNVPSPVIPVAPAGGTHAPVTKTSLAYKGPPAPPVGTGHNVAARPFSATPQVNGVGADPASIKSIASKQYNSPVGLYSDQNIAETLSAQAEVLAGGVLGVNFMKNEKAYNANNSEVLKMVQEIDKEPKDPEPARPSSVMYYAAHSHMVGGRATSPRPMTPLAQQLPPPPPDRYPSQLAPTSDSPKCTDCSKLIVGSRVPSGVVPAPTSAGPQSPQPGTLAPLPFHAPSSNISGPKPFGGPTSAAPPFSTPSAPVSAPAPAPFSSVSTPPAAPKSAPFSSPPAPPSFPKNLPEKTSEQIKEIEDVACCVDRSKRMSVCSSEVCSLSEKKSAVKEMATLTEDPNRASPVPFIADKKVSEAFSKCDQETLRQSENVQKSEEGNVQITRKTKVEESLVRSQKMYTAEVSTSQLSAQVRASSPEMEQIMAKRQIYQSYQDSARLTPNTFALQQKAAQSERCLTPEIEHLMEKPHGTWSPMPAACFVRPISPNHIVSYPPDIPPVPATLPRPRTATPEQFQEARETVERFVDHTKQVHHTHSNKSTKQASNSLYSQQYVGQQYTPRYDNSQGFSAYVGRGNSGDSRNGNSGHQNGNPGNNGARNPKYPGKSGGGNSNDNPKIPAKDNPGDENGKSGNKKNENAGNGNYYSDKHDEPTVTEPDDDDEGKYSRKSSRADHSQKSSRKTSASEEESTRRVFSDFGGPQISSSVEVESTTEGGVQKTSVKKSQKMEYSTCEFESSRKSTIVHDKDHDSSLQPSGGAGEKSSTSSGEQRKYSFPKFKASEDSTGEEEMVTKSQVEEIIKQELNKVFQMAQTMETTNFGEMYTQKSQSTRSEQSHKENSEQSTVQIAEQYSSQTLEQKKDSSDKSAITGEIITKTGKLTSGLTIAPARPFTPQALETNYPLPHQNLPSDFPPPRPYPEPPKAKPSYVPVTGDRSSPFIQALTIASDRPYSPLPTATVIETPLITTPPKPKQSSMVEALTTAPSTPFQIQNVSLKVTEDKSGQRKTECKYESTQKYAPKPTETEFKPISEPKPATNYVSTTHTVETCNLKSFPPVTDELKSAFKSTSQVQSSKFSDSERQHVEMSKQTVKTSEQKSSSVSRTERSTTPSGLHPPNLLPYYQQHIGEIPLAHRSNSPVPHQIKAPSTIPPTAQSVPCQGERRSSVKALGEAYLQQLATQNSQQTAASGSSTSSVSYISAGAYSSGAVTKTYSYEQEHKSIDAMGYHASPLAGKLPLAGEQNLPKCSSPLLGKLDHTKQVFKPSIPPQQSSSAFRSTTAEQANLRQAPPFFVKEKDLAQPPLVVAKERDDEEIINISFKPPQPTPSINSFSKSSKPSLPTFPLKPSLPIPNVNKTLPAFPEPSKPFSVPGVTKPPTELPDAGPGGAPKGGTTAGTTAPRRGKGVMNTGVAAGARVPQCGSCNSQIRGPFITALGKIWCPDHFVCVNAQCRRPLQDIGFVEDPRGLYCEYCFEQYLAPTCNKCNAKVKGDCLNAIGKHFHPECFTCAYCGKHFGNNPFFLEDALPYCEADWNELFTTKCFSCGFPIEAGDRWVEALNNNYHSQCFNCTMCKKNLEGQSFFAKGGRPFCKNHAR